MKIGEQLQRKTGLNGKEFIAFVAMVGCLTGALNTFVPKKRGIVVDQVRTEVCRFEADHPITENVLSAVNCKLFIAARKPQSTAPLKYKGMEEIGDIERTDNITQTKSRVDKATSQTQGGVITRLLLPALTGASAEISKGGIWQVTENGGPINLQELVGVVPVPEPSKSNDPNQVICNYGPGDPLYEGCFSNQLSSGLLAGIPLVGSDNNGNIARSGLIAFVDAAKDLNCPFNQVLAPGLRQPGQSAPSNQEVAAILTRAHLRYDLWKLRGVVPQKVDIPIDPSHPFDAGPTIQAVYSEQKKNGREYLPDIPLPADYCVGATNIKLNNSASGNGGLDLSWLANMGAEQVKNGFNPGNGQFNDPAFTR